MLRNEIIEKLLQNEIVREVPIKYICVIISAFETIIDENGSEIDADE